MFAHPTQKRQTLSSISALLILLLLTGCTSTPSRNYSSLVVSRDDSTKDHREWLLKELAAKGSIKIKATLIETGSSAADVGLIFKQGSQERIIEISLRDPGCTGRYGITSRYEPRKNIQEYSRFDIKPQWGETLTLAISWDRSGMIVVRLNDKELQTFNIRLAVDNFTIAPRTGGINIYSLDYQNLN